MTPEPYAASTNVKHILSKRWHLRCERMEKMKKIEPLKIKIRRSSDSGFFHDSREDVRVLGEAINKMIDKQNEIIEKVNLLIEGDKNV